MNVYISVNKVNIVESINKKTRPRKFVTLDKTDLDARVFCQGKGFWR